MKNSIKALVGAIGLMSALAASANPIVNNLVAGTISLDRLTVSGDVNSTPFSYTLDISSPPSVIFGSGQVIFGEQNGDDFVVRGSTTAFDGMASTFGLDLITPIGGATSGTVESADNYLNFSVNASGNFDAIAQFDLSGPTPKIAAFVYDPTGGSSIDISSGIANVVAGVGAVPEPSTLALGGLALAGLLVARRRQ